VPWPLVFKRHRLSNPFEGANVLLYAAIIFDSAVLGLCGLALSPMIWRSRETTNRHVALAISLLLLALSPRFLAFNEFFATLQTQVAMVAVAPTFAFRASLLPLLVLLPTLQGRIVKAVALNASMAAAFVALLQVLALRRIDLETIGFVTFGFVAALEVVNAWSFWKASDKPAGRGLLVVAMVIASIVLVQWSPPSIQRRQSIVRVWWPTAPLPEFGTVDQGYGWSRIGHVGEFPRLLEKAGYTVTRRSDLEGLNARLLVLPVPFRRLKSAEIASVRRYVSDGGRVILIGEHTNLDGVRDDFNQVLAGTGVSLNFDTTNALFGDGTLALTGPHVSRNIYLTHNRGASLAVKSLRAVPLLVGSWWHSDYGEALAPDRAYLSDYRLSPKDRVGNLVLSAAVPFGRGRFVVWGDGSPFLNQNLVFNSRYVLNIVDDLTADMRGRWTAPIGVAILLMLWLISRQIEIIGVTAIVALLAPFVWSHEAPLVQPLGVVSDAENNGFDRNAFSDKGITALGVSLTRAGYTPWLGDWRQLPSPPGVLFVLNPNCRITNSYVGRIRRIAEAGGTVVITGAGDSPTFRALAERFDAHIVGAPIGSLVGGTFTTYSAWRLESTQGVKLMALDIPVGVVQSIGTGRIVLVADPGFLLSKNLETENEYDLMNLQFLRQLIASP
jgi:hypothetical protein